MSRKDILEVTREGTVERELFEQIDLDRLPRHVAVIMDGNGRWAQKRGLPRVEGHRAGIASVREAVETCARLDVPVLTLYAFSVENWKRPKTEVDVLMKLLKQYLRLELSTLMRNDIRFQVLGRIQELPKDVVTELESGMERTRDRGEAPALDEAAFARHLYTEGISDPDLLIRTSGELRISNFLLWQIAYAEIWVTETLWPDFRKRDLFEAIVDFQKRERRYGGIAAPTSSPRSSPYLSSSC
jgi:undecaprenyl diphosphate synthase